MQSFYCIGLLDTLPLSQHDRVHVGLVAIYLVSVLATEGSILEYGAALGGQYKHNNTRLSQRQSGVEAGEFRALDCNQCVCVCLVLHSSRLLGSPFAEVGILT